MQVNAQCRQQHPAAPAQRGHYTRLTRAGTLKPA
jgi:hypothetical protein